MHRSRNEWRRNEICLTNSKRIIRCAIPLKLYFPIRHSFTPKPANALWSGCFGRKEILTGFLYDQSPFIMQFWQLQCQNENEARRFFRRTRKPRQMRNKSTRKRCITSNEKYFSSACFSRVSFHALAQRRGIYFSWFTRFSLCFISKLNERKMWQSGFKYE